MSNITDEFILSCMRSTSSDLNRLAGSLTQMALAMTYSKDNPPIETLKVSFERVMGDEATLMVDNNRVQEVHHG